MTYIKVEDSGSETESDEGSRRQVGAISEASEGSETESDEGSRRQVGAISDASDDDSDSVDTDSGDSTEAEETMASADVVTSVDDITTSAPSTVTTSVVTTVPTTGIGYHLRPYSGDIWHRRSLLIRQGIGHSFGAGTSAATDILDLLEENKDLKRRLVNMTETNKRLKKRVRPPVTRSRSKMML
jgi:hypothetical protein